MQNYNNYKTILENYPNGFALFEIPSFKIIGCKASFTELLGYTKEELLVNQSINQLMDFVQSLKVEKDISISDLQDSTIRIILTRKDGSLIDKEVLVRKLSADNKDLLIISDPEISPKYKTELALKTIESKYRILFDTMKQGVVFRESNSNILSANKAAQEMFGFKEDNLIDKNPFTEWKVEQEDGSLIQPNEFSSYIALHSGKEVRNLTMGVTRPEVKGVRWFNVDTVAYIQDENSQPDFVYIFFEDITEKKKAKAHERELFQKSKQSLVDTLQRQLAIDQHGIVSITNIAGTIQYVNERFCEISGYSIEELLGKNHRLINSGYHSKEFFTNMYATLKKGIAWQGEVRNRAKDGHCYWVSSTIAPVKNADGKIEQYVSIRTDITARMRVEENLRHHQIELEMQNTELIRAQEELDKARARYFDLYDLAPVGYLTVAENGLILEANRTAVNLLGTEQSKLLNQPLSKFINKDDQKVYFLNRRKLLNTLIPQSSEMRMIKKDGTQFWAGIETTIDQNREDRTIVSRVVLSDISDRKRTEERILKSEMLNRVILETAIDGFLLLNVQGEILEVNYSYCQMSGYSRTEILALGISGLEAKESEEDIRSRVKKIIEVGVARFETWHRHKDGHLFDVEISVQYQSESERFILFLRDITDRIQKERIARSSQIELANQNKTLEDLNQTKDKFFSIIAHDLRNPFSGIIGLSEILESKLIEANNELSNQLLKFTQMIQVSSNSAYTLLENLLLWARSQTGELVVRPVHLPINYLISEVVIPIVNGNAYKKNISIETQLKDNYIVFADESIVSTILRNLLSNAIKFTKNNGKITVSTENKGNFLEISVTDTGIGIDPINVDKILRIDSKFSKPGTDNEKGTGLGLTICKEFVEKHGGTIWIASELGVGSTFTFTLPLGQ